MTKETGALKKYGAEFIGTMVLVLMGCGAAVLDGGDIGILGISLAFGLAVLVMVYAIGPISGCHINPAITIAMRAGKKIGTKDAIWYIIFQILGAILGIVIVYFIASQNPDRSLAVSGLAANTYNPEAMTMWGAILTEVVMTALFLLVIFGATDKKAPAGFAGIAIGLALALIHMVSIPITNTSVNPARSIAPALFVGGEALSQLWIFILAPIVGGLIGLLIWKMIKGKETA